MARMIISFLFFVFYAFPAHSAPKVTYMKGHQLLSVCTSDDMGVRAMCNGYTMGVYDVSQGIAFNGDRFCIPEGVPDFQLVKVVIKYLEEWPEDLHYNAYALIQFALVSAFPCNKVGNE